MAEAIINARFADWKASCAGTKPAGFVHPKAIATLADIGITHTGESKSIDALSTKDYDLVLTVCDTAAEECPVWPGKADRRVHHEFKDPANAAGTEAEIMNAFRIVRDQMLEILPGYLR